MFYLQRNVNIGFLWLYVTLARLQEDVCVYTEEMMHFDIDIPSLWCCSII